MCDLYGCRQGLVVLALWSSGNVWGMQCKGQTRDTALSYMSEKHQTGYASVQGLGLNHIEFGCLLCCS